MNKTPHKEAMVYHDPFTDYEEISKDGYIYGFLGGLMLGLILALAIYLLVAGGG